MTVEVNAANGTAIGAIDGRTDIRVFSSSLKVNSSGEKMLAFGGNSTDTKIDMMRADVKVSVRSNLNRDTFAKEENIKIVDGQARFTVNGTAVEHTVIVKD